MHASERWDGYNKVRSRLKEILPDSEGDFVTAHIYINSDPDKAVNACRKTLECFVKHLVGRLGMPEVEGGSLLDGILLLSRLHMLHPRIKARMHFVRESGNMASHHGVATEVPDAERAFDDLLFIANWLCESRTAVDDAGKGTLSPALSAGLAALKKRIEDVSDEQRSVLDYLKFHRKVAISGSAGSGKTLLAMTKASWLDRAGNRVLFLCHNPFLAEFVSDALIYTHVRVMPFKAWVLADVLETEDTGTWNHYDALSAAEIDRAFDRLSGTQPFYDAVIVDEAQDFDDGWWLLVEAAARSEAAFLYIFYDNNQALLPLRSNYPVSHQAHALTTNVRNSAEIANAVARFNRTPVQIPAALAGGVMTITRYAKGQEMAAVGAALAEVYAEGLLDGAIVVTTEAIDPRDSALAGQHVDIRPLWSWQDALRECTTRIVSAHRTRAPSAPQSRFHWPELSREPYPTAADRAAVTRWAATVRSAVPGLSHAAYHDGTVRWNVFARSIEVATTGTVINPSALIGFLHTGDWASRLPRLPRVRLVPAGDEKRGLTMPLHSAASVKGIEADSVITVIPAVVSEVRAQAYVALSRARLHQQVLMLDDVARHLPGLN